MFQRLKLPKYVYQYQQNLPNLIDDSCEMFFYWFSTKLRHWGHANKGMPEEFLKTKNIIDSLNQAALNPIKIEPEEFKQEFYEDDHFDQNDYPIDTKPLGEFF